MNRAVITVQGGVVQSVLTDDPKMKVLVIDYDVDHEDDICKKDREGNDCNMFRDEYVDSNIVEELFANYEKQGGVVNTDYELRST